MEVFFSRRLTNAFRIEASTVSTIDFDAFLAHTKRVPVQIVYTWIKTIANAWCTSSRMHEDTSYSCLFGCAGASDELRHYLVCPTLLACACSALNVPDGDPIRRAESILATLGLRPMNSNAYYVVYIAFCLYHERKNRYVVEYGHNIEHMQVEFSSDDERRTKAYAHATAKKLEGMRGTASGVIPGAAPVFLQGLDPWIGVAHPR